MSLPSGTPSRKRTTTSQPTLVAKAYSSAKTMNMTIVARNMTRRPILSDSQPPDQRAASRSGCGQTERQWVRINRGRDAHHCARCTDPYGR